MRVETTYSTCIQTEMFSLRELSDLPSSLFSQIQELLKIQLPSVVLVSEPAHQESSEDRGINFEIIYEARKELKDLYQRFDQLSLDLQALSKEMCPQLVTELMKQLESLKATVQINLDQLTQYLIEEGYLDSEVSISELTQEVESLAPKMRSLAKERLFYYEELYWLLARTLCDNQTKKPIEEARVLSNGNLYEKSSLSPEALKDSIECSHIPKIAQLIQNCLRKIDIYSPKLLEKEENENWKVEFNQDLSEVLELLAYEASLKKTSHPVVALDGMIYSKEALKSSNSSLHYIESKSLLELTHGLMKIKERCCKE